MGLLEILALAGIGGVGTALIVEKDKAEKGAIGAIAGGLAGLIVQSKATALEGEYTHWDKIWAYQLPAVSSYSVGFTIGPAHVYAHCMFELSVINLADGTLKAAYPGDAYHDINMAYHDDYGMNRAQIGSYSVGSKYLALLKYGYYAESGQFDVFKNGELTWTSGFPSEYVANADHWRLLCISHNGKYILAVTEVYLRGICIVCFKGS